MTSCLLTWRMKSSQNGGLLKRKEFALIGANSFLYEMTQLYIGGTNENDRVASPESVLIHLKVYFNCDCAILQSSQDMIISFSYQITFCSI